MTWPVLAAAAAVSIPARPLPRADGPLEPSYANEVAHAIDAGERWLASRAPGGASSATNSVRGAARDLFGTNGLSRAEIAVKLVSMQRGGGWWIAEGDAAPTRLALEILKSL